MNDKEGRDPFAYYGVFTAGESVSRDYNIKIARTFADEEVLKLGDTLNSNTNITYFRMIK